MNRAEQGMAVYLGEERLKFLQAVTVGIAGAGGLGSNCAMHLVRSGFRRFVIADHDRVEPSNLNRQAFRLDQVGEDKVAALAENMRGVNPEAAVEMHVLRLTPENVAEVFAECDVVVEALDDARAKAMVVEAFAPTAVLLVAASGMGGAGNADDIVTRKVRKNLYLVGDMETECGAENPPFSPRVGVAAAKQADVVLAHFLAEFNKRGKEA
jgi:sulfur carrier protein ThiS adenylyltransferase